MKITWNNNEYEVEVYYQKAEPGRRYKGNGDPGDPPSPAYVEIECITCIKTGRELKRIPEKMKQDIKEKVPIEESENEYEEMALAAEWERDIDR